MHGAAAARGGARGRSWGVVGEEDAAVAAHEGRGARRPLRAELGERLNVLTGDNGLGKSFVLDVAWWVLTGTWVARAVLPRTGNEQTAEIGFQLDLPKRYEGQPHIAPRLLDVLDGLGTRMRPQVLMTTHSP